LCWAPSRARFFLYGIAMAYAVSGTTKLDEIGMRVASSSLDPAFC
jgi:NADH:ubiquinone oxidoreductase subunit 2 (subunit N)